MPSSDSWYARRGALKQMLASWQGVSKFSLSQIVAFDVSIAIDGFDDPPSQVLQRIINENPGIFRQGIVPAYGYWVV